MIKLANACREWVSPPPPSCTWDSTKNSILDSHDVVLADSAADARDLPNIICFEMSRSTGPRASLGSPLFALNATASRISMPSMRPSVTNCANAGSAASMPDMRPKCALAMKAFAPAHRAAAVPSTAQGGSPAISAAGAQRHASTSGGRCSGTALCVRGCLPSTDINSTVMIMGSSRITMTVAETASLPVATNVVARAIMGITAITSSTIWAMPFASAV